MNGKIFFQSLIKEIDNIEYYHFFDIYDYTTYKIRTIVEHFIIVNNLYSLRKLLTLLRELELTYVILGNGSKVLFKDKYVKKIVISTKNLNTIQISDDMIIVNAGVSLQKLIQFANSYNLGGIEELAAIPASIGGAIYNNCSAHNVCISDYVYKVEYFDFDGHYKTLLKDNCQFSYRSSIFKKQKKHIITNVYFKFKPIDKNVAKEKIKTALLYRNHHQPKNKRNCGSVFKNTKSYKAYEIIRKANLQGIRQNGAIISIEHANFIINDNQATSEDIIYLINLIRSRVKDLFAIDLELELEII